MPKTLLLCLQGWTNAVPDNVPDSILIQRSVAGDTDAYGILIRRYEDRLVHSLEHALGSRDDALDAAQQAFVSAWTKLKSFREDSAFYSWIYRIAMNAAISVRRKRRIPTASLQTHVEASGALPADKNETSDPQHRLNTEERVRLVRAALGQLAEEFRQPLVMKEIDNFSYEEIASFLDIPVGTVRSRIFRARKEMTERLKRIFADD